MLTVDVVLVIHTTFGVEVRPLMQ